MTKLFIIFFYILFQANVFASDPFTQEIGIIKIEPEIIEVSTEEVVEKEELEEIQEIVEVVIEEEEEPVIQPEPENTEIVTILNIDPIIAFSLKDYTLKGTAFTKENKHQFKRTKVQKIDRAKTPTTHLIEESDTVEKIAFRYGFPLREIELANAIYPGSRKLVVGDRLVIPSRFHIVKEGQSLNSIADRYKINSIQLATYNNIEDQDILLIGDKLLLPFFIHVTSEKETMSDIAGRYEREIVELIEFNNFSEDTLVLNENQLIKIPIYANKNTEYSVLDKKSINDFNINRKNLAIISIDDAQFMVREGDRIGNKNGIIVSIESNKMIVLENNIEFEFFINTPIAGQAIASLPKETIDGIGQIEQNNGSVTNEENDSITNNDISDNNQNDTVTNVEDLFN